MKFLVALWLVLLGSASLSAQVKFAINAGYNHNTARIHKNDVLQITGYVPGANAAFRVEANFEDPLYFTGQVGYNMRGYKYQKTPDTSLTTRIHYVDISPMFNFHFRGRSLDYLNVFAGPVVGVALSGQQTIESPGGRQTESMKFSLTSNYSLVNVGIQMGLGYNFNHWFLESSYHLGVSSINNEEESDRTNIKNRGFAFSVGYWFH